MKQLIIRLLIFSSILYVPWIYMIYAYPYFFHDRDYFTWVKKYELLEAPIEEFNPRHVAFGDSLLVSSLNPTLIDDSLYNFGLPGATPQDVYFIVSDYLDSGRRPERIYLSFGTMHYQISDSFYESHIYYRHRSFADFSEIVKTMREYGFLYRPFNLKTFDNPWVLSFFAYLEFFLNRLGLDYTHLDLFRFNLLEGRLVDIASYAAEHQADLHRTQGQHFFGQREYSIDINEIQNYDYFEMHPTIQFYLEKLLKKLEREQVEVVIEWVPVNHASWSHLSDEYLGQAEAYFRGLEQEFQNVSYQSLSSYPSHYFGDTDHHNHRGSAKFSQEFKERYYSAEND